MLMSQHIVVILINELVNYNSVQQSCLTRGGKNLERNLAWILYRFMRDLIKFD